LWEHYLFSLDLFALVTDAFAVLVRAALFLLAYMVHDKHGYLVTAPSTSPENSYINTQQVGEGGLEREGGRGVRVMSQLHQHSAGERWRGGWLECVCGEVGERWCEW
jgi:hypothetical protein